MLAKNDLDNGEYASAALHAKAAIENYPQAPAIPEAASITNEAYKMLKLENPDAETAGDASMRNRTVTSNATLDELPAPDVKEPVIIPFKAKEAPRDQQSPPAKKPAAVMQTAAAEQPVVAVTPETPQPAPVPAGETMMQSADGIRQDSWILAQDPASYTIQLLGTGNEKLLVALIKRLNLTDKAAYYRNASLDRPWFALTYGTYSSVSEANEAINRLPDDLLKGQPWIRKYGDIQPLINVQ